MAKKNESLATIHERIAFCVQKYGEGKNTLFAEKLGVSEGNIRGYIKGVVPKADVLEKIVRTYEISPEWLLTGRGDIVLSDFSRNHQTKSEENTHESEKNIAHPARNPQEGIPLIPFSAMAGALTGEQTAFEYECERYVVPAFKGADFLMQIKGTSMQPTYISGDIVACQKVPMTSIFFQWNKPYVIDTKQGPLVKRIKPGSDKEHITLVSDNTDYDPFELPLEEVNAVALVVGLIRLE